jgi:hypothetical protein
VGFWSSLLVEVLGGVVTAALLGAVGVALARDVRKRATAQAAADLNEDARRFIRDRDQRMSIELRGKQTEMAARGQLYSGALPRGLAHLKRLALHEYRDEMTRKRRRYRELCDGQGGTLARLLRLTVPVPPFELDDESREVLARWRADAQVPQAGASHPVDDPTSEELEPDLRRWEAEGDRCDG